MQLVHSNKAIKPYFIPELGCEGLSTRDIAESTCEELRVINQKVKRSNFQRTLNSLKLLAITTVIEGNQYVTGEIHYLETKAAKILVSRLENEFGDGYINFLLECEQIVLEEIPHLIAERDSYRAKIASIEQELARITQKRIPGRRAGQIAVPVWDKDMFGNENIVRYEMKTKEEVDEITYLRGQLRHMQTVLVSLQNKTKDKTEEIMTKEMDRENKVLDLFSSKPT